MKTLVKLSRKESHVQVSGFGLQGGFSSESALSRVVTGDCKETTPREAEDPALRAAIEMDPG